LRISFDLSPDFSGRIDRISRRPIEMSATAIPVPKRSQLFIGMHDETLSIAGVR